MAKNNDSIYVNIHYVLVVDPNQELTNVNLASIRDNHELLNLCLGMKNPDINTTPEFFKAFVGNCNVIVKPLNPALLEYTFVTTITATNRVFQDLDDVEDFCSKIGGYQAEVGYITCYICNLSGGLLGQAVLNGNSLVVTSGSVGANWEPGTGSDDYNTGKTLVHEFGHVLGLRHPFANGNCDEYVLPDIPLQYMSNVGASIEYDNDLGYYVVSKDNRTRDCLAPQLNRPGQTPPYSCISYIQGFDCNATLFQPEAINLFMSYSIDKYLVNFSADEAANTHMNLLSNKLINTFNADGLEIGTITSDSNDSMSEDRTVAIVLISISFIILVILLAFSIKQIKKTNGST